MGTDQLQSEINLSKSEKKLLISCGALILAVLNLVGTIQLIDTISELKKDKEKLQKEHEDLRKELEVIRKNNGSGK